MPRAQSICFSQATSQLPGSRFLQQRHPSAPFPDACSPSLSGPSLCYSIHLLDTVLWDFFCCLMSVLPTQRVQLLQHVPATSPGNSWQGPTRRRRSIRVGQGIHLKVYHVIITPLISISASMGRCDSFTRNIRTLWTKRVNDSSLLKKNYYYISWIYKYYIDIQIMLCCCLVAQSRLILCDPMNCSPPVSPCHFPGKNIWVGCYFLLQITLHGSIYLSLQQSILLVVKD